MTLSDPGLFQGREVYRCYTLTVSPSATGEPSCLQEEGNGYWYLAPSGSTGPTATTPAAATTPPLTPTTAAAAGRPPTPSERLAITQAARRGLTDPSKLVVSDIRVSTVGPWAKAEIEINDNSGTDIFHEVSGQWIDAGGGTAGEWCVMPPEDQTNLGFQAGLLCAK